MSITKEKGDIGLTKIIADLTENNINVSIPIAEHLKYDIIIEKDSKMFRVQARYSKADKNNSYIQVKLKSVWSNKSGSYSVNREKGDYDILAIYCPYTNKCYYLSDEEFDPGAAINLRLTPPKTKNGGVIRMAKDYESIFKAIKNNGSVAESG